MTNHALCCNTIQTKTKKTNKTVYWILAASKGWIKQTYRKIMHTQNTQYTIEQGALRTFYDHGGLSRVQTGTQRNFTHSVTRS